MAVSQSRIPVVWSIGHSDSSGGTGIQADIHTFHDFNVYGCNVVTAIVAQNSFATGYSVATERKAVIAQINALDSDLPADVIKLGMVPNMDVMEPVAKYLTDYEGTVIYDLELQTSDGWLMQAFAQLKTVLLSRVDLLVVNTEEAAALADLPIRELEDMVRVADYLLAAGPKAVFITGARFADAGGRRVDYWSNGGDGWWVSVDAVDSVDNRGGGSTLSAALAAALANGEPIDAAIKLAKAYVTRGIRDANRVGSGPGSVAHRGLPPGIDDCPVMTREAPLL